MKNPKNDNQSNLDRINQRIDLVRQELKDSKKEAKTIKREKLKILRTIQDLHVRKNQGEDVSRAIPHNYLLKEIKSEEASLLYEERSELVEELKELESMKRKITQAINNPPKSEKKKLRNRNQLIQAEIGAFEYQKLWAESFMESVEESLHEDYIEKANGIYMTYFGIPEAFRRYLDMEQPEEVKKVIIASALEKIEQKYKSTD